MEIGTRRIRSAALLVVLTVTLDFNCTLFDLQGEPRSNPYDPVNVEKGFEEFSLSCAIGESGGIQLTIADHSGIRFPSYQVTRHGPETKPYIIVTDATEYLDVNELIPGELYHYDIAVSGVPAGVNTEQRYVSDAYPGCEMVYDPTTDDSSADPA